MPIPAAAVPDALYELELFVAGNATKSVLAIQNIQALCATYLPGRHTLTIVDLYQHPERASQEELLGVPCLIKRRPGLVRRLVGDLSNQQRVLTALGLA